MRWCAHCRRRLQDDSAAFCPFDGTRLEPPSLGDANRDPYLGATLQNQFHLQDAIGSGAMGTVYRAWQSGMERPVAVKLLRADLMADREVRRRFLREGRTAARLNHPNIVSVYVVGETDTGVPYLVMEHLGGEALDQLLDREGRLPAARAVRIARQIAAALAEAHAAGIVHRDLKPGNIVLLHRRGAGELVKIFDFGIAKIVDGALVSGAAGRLTREGAIFGTPDYIAPEQAQGGPIDGRADLYSLGILLYRMLAGRLPFEGNAVAVLLAHLGRDPVHLAAIAPSVPPALAAVVMKCLAKRPGDRIASADLLIDALDRIETAARAPSPADSPSWVASRPEPVPASRPASTSASWVVSRPEPIPTSEGSSRPERLSAGRTASRAAARSWGRAGLLGTAIAVVCTGTGTGVAALFRGSPDAAAGERGEAARPPWVEGAGPAEAPGALRSILLSEGGYAVRALIPEPVGAGRPVELLFDVWDPSGAPLRSPAIPVQLATRTSVAAGAAGEPEAALAARPMAELPGRYRLVASFPQPGEAAALLELGGSSIHVHFEVAPVTR